MIKKQKISEYLREEIFAKEGCFFVEYNNSRRRYIFLISCARFLASLNVRLICVKLIFRWMRFCTSNICEKWWAGGRAEVRLFYLPFECDHYSRKYFAKRQFFTSNVESRLARRTFHTFKGYVVYNFRFHFRYSKRIRKIERIFLECFLSSVQFFGFLIKRLVIKFDFSFVLLEKLAKCENLKVGKIRRKIL